MAVLAEELIAAFRRKGMKITPQRQLLCTLVEKAHDQHEHPTVEALHLRAMEEMPTISLKTVYSTLSELAELGMIRLVALGTGSVRVDPNPAPHAHFVCRSCGRIIDHPLDLDDDTESALESDLGFVVEERDVIYRGRCAACRSQETGEAVLLKEGDVSGNSQHR